MAAQTPKDVDEHHREIWSDAQNSQRSDRPVVYYVENHNASTGYADAAFDFQLLAVELLPRLGPGELRNWTGPVLHLTRQTIELRLKALLQCVAEEDPLVDARALAKHDLAALWSVSREWLPRSGYGLLEDARIEATDSLVKAFDAVDPVGDLFRFAQSRQARFGKRKSYDRVGINPETFPGAVREALGLLQHWHSVLIREQFRKDPGWSDDGEFDPNDYPRRANADRGAA